MVLFVLIFCLFMFQYLMQFSLAPSYSLEEFEHWFMPRPGIVDSYVVEGPGGKITDFVSFYTLPSTVMHHPKYKMLKAAYSFYNVCTSGNWTELMQDTLIAARNVSSITQLTASNILILRLLNLSRWPLICPAVKRSVAGCKIQFFSLYLLTNCYHWSIRSPAALFEIENTEYFLDELWFVN